MGFQGLEYKQPRSGSSATPSTYPEARHAQKKYRFNILDHVGYGEGVWIEGNKQMYISSFISYLRTFVRDKGKLIYHLSRLISVKGASLATEEILCGVRGRLVWDESETFSSFDRWSFGERRTKKKGYSPMV